MKARKRGLVILVVALFALTPIIAMAKSVPVASGWAVLPPKLDGHNEDWLGEAMNFEKSVSVDYAFRNDDRNLYILFIFKDPKFLSSIVATGITVYASATGKKDKSSGVRFLQKILSPEELIAMAETRGMSLSEERKEEIRKMTQYIHFEAEVVNKKGEIVSVAGASENVDPPAFRAMKQGKFLVYEFRIPLISKNLHPAGIGAKPGQGIKIGFEWGGMTREMKEALAFRQSESATRASATDSRFNVTEMGEDEGAPTGGSSSSLAAMRKGPIKHSFWVDVKLAQSE